MISLMSTADCLGVGSEKFFQRLRSSSANCQSVVIGITCPPQLTCPQFPHGNLTKLNQHAKSYWRSVVLPVQDPRSLGAKPEGCKQMLFNFPPVEAIPPVAPGGLSRLRPDSRLDKSRLRETAKATKQRTPQQQ